MSESLDEHVDQDVRARAAQRVGDLVCGKWRLDKLLSVGGTSAVYAASHRNGMHVAVKILHPALSVVKQARKRFLREGYAANSLGHDSVARVLDDDETEDGSAFLVMELLEGASAASLARARGGHLSPSEVAALGDGLLDLLAAAHDKAIWHRDIKPENLFLTLDGKIKVLGFGLAKLAQEQGTHGTGAGSLFGTPAFMPPEQALGKWNEVDGRSDLWAAGATLFHLWSGHLVHDAETAAEARVAAATTAVPSVASLDTSIPRDVAEVLDRALAFDKAERWEDARSMRKALATALPRRDLSGLLRHLGGVAAAGTRTQPQGTPRVALSDDEPAKDPTAMPMREEPRTSVLGALQRTARGREWMLLGAGALFAVVVVAWFVLTGEPDVAPAPPRSPVAASASAAQTPALASSVEDPEERAVATPAPTTARAPASAAPQSAEDFDPYAEEETAPTPAPSAPPAGGKVFSNW